MFEPLLLFAKNNIQNNRIAEQLIFFSNTQHPYKTINLHNNLCILLRIRLIKVDFTKKICIKQYCNF